MTNDSTNDPRNDQRNEFAEIPIEDLYDSENPLVPGRICGSCMLCCKVMIVDELNKPSGTLCRHAVLGKGCFIREQRPRSWVPRSTPGAGLPVGRRGTGAATRAGR